MLVEVYYDARRSKNGKARIEGALRRLREAGVKYRVIDTSEQPTEEVERAYITRAVPAAMVRQYGIRRLFGTHSKPGVYFGRETPAIVVVEDGQPRDVYPHVERDGRVVDIDDYVDSVAMSHERADLVRKMAALRREIGGIGATTAELVREARAETAYGDDEGPAS